MTYPQHGGDPPPHNSQAADDDEEPRDRRGLPSSYRRKAERHLPADERRGVHKVPAAQVDPVLHTAAILLAAVLRSHLFTASHRPFIDVDDALTWLRKALAPAIPAHPALPTIGTILNVDRASRWDDPRWAKVELQRLCRQLARQAQGAVQKS